MRTYNMNKKRYRLAYKFLKARATKGGLAPLQTLNECTDADRTNIIRFLSYCHQVKFI